MRNIGLYAALWIGGIGLALAADALQLDAPDKRIGYSLGYQIGGDFKRQGVAIDSQAVIRGMEDALSGTQPLLPPQQMQSTLVELKRKVVADERARMRELELARIAEGRKFLEENAKKPGVITTASGLQYRIVAEGTGRKPSPSDEVTVHYRGTLVNGNEFDSSHARGGPARFPLNGVIRGWTEGLQLIKEGGRIELFIPPALAYGDRGPLANQTLIFDVELLAVGSAKVGEGQASATEVQSRAN